LDNGIFSALVEVCIPWEFSS